MEKLRQQKWEQEHKSLTVAPQSSDAFTQSAPPVLERKDSMAPGLPAVVTSARTKVLPSIMSAIPEHLFKVPTIEAPSDEDSDGSKEETAGPSTSSAHQVSSEGDQDSKYMVKVPRPTTGDIERKKKGKAVKKVTTSDEVQVITISDEDTDGEDESKA